MEHKVRETVSTVEEKCDFIQCDKCGAILHVNVHAHGRLRRSMPERIRLSGRLYTMKPAAMTLILKNPSITTIVPDVFCRH